MRISARARSIFCIGQQRALSSHSLRRASMSAMRDKTDLGRNRRYDRFRPKADEVIGPCFNRRRNAP